MGKHAANFEQKVEWLVRHPFLVKKWPDRFVERLMIAGMRTDGLIARGTNDWDLGDFGKLVMEARDRIKRRAKERHDQIHGVTGPPSP